MLRETVNNSIGSKARHLQEDQIVGLFYKTGAFDPIERYAASIIFSEASLQEILLFLRQHHIPLSNAKTLYRVFIQERTALKPKERRDKYGWFFG